jgi:hypothetical protein
MKRRARFLFSASVAPDPANGSSTTSPGSENASILGLLTAVDHVRTALRPPPRTRREIFRTFQRRLETAWRTL